MNLNNINSLTKINPVAEEIKINLNSDNNKVLLLLHGFGGKSSNWEYAAKKINQSLNLPIYIPRLPGHGTNTSDFLNSSAEQWLRKAVDSYLYLKKDFDKIFLAGLSMGGLLAALLASKFKVEKLSLVAPAFFAANKNIIFAPLLKYFIKEMDNDFQIEEKNLTTAEINYHQNYSFKYYTEALAELYKLMKKGRKAASKINVPSQLILSLNDEQVDTKKIEKFLDKKMGQFLVDKKIYQKSSHVIINDTEKQRCAEDLIKFLK